MISSEHLSLGDSECLSIKLMQSGLFSAALQVQRQRLHSLTQLSPSHPVEYLRAGIAHIYLGNLQVAEELLSQPMNFSADYVPTKHALRQAQAYLSMCLTQSFHPSKNLSRLSKDDRVFLAWARDKTALLIGPGQLSGQFNTVGEKVIARMPKEGTTSLSNSDPYPDRCEMAYVNSHTRATVLNPREFFSKFPFVTFTSNCDFYAWKHSLTSWVRVQSNLGSVFWSGAAWLGIATVYDLLSAPFDEIEVDGIDLFAGKIAYRTGSRQIRDGKQRDQFGKIGGEFERCRALAGHNPFVNRWILRSMALSPRLKLSQVLRSVVSMPDCEYAEILDTVYGQGRI